MNNFINSEVEKISKYGLASYNIKANQKYANIIEALDKYVKDEDSVDEERTALNTMRVPQKEDNASKVYEEIYFQILDT